MKLLSASLKVALVMALATPVGTIAAPGDLDPAFGVDGVASLSMGRAIHTPTGFAAQADGKYYVSFEAPVANGGGANGGTPAGSAPFGGGVARFNADHTIDTSWGYQGVAGQGLTVNGLTLRNGQLLTIENGLLPFPSTYFGNEYPYVARYTANGNLDTGFGSDNGRTSPLSTGGTIGYQQRFNAIAVAPDGKIVVAGHKEGLVLVARFNADGSPDTPFGAAVAGAVAGWVTVPIGLGGVTGVANAVAVQPDGGIVVAGSYGTTPRAFIARMTAGGVLDPAFGSGGVFSFSAAADPSECRGVIIDGSRIIAGCQTSAGGAGDLLLLGLGLAGALDPTFAGIPIDLGGAQDKLFAMFRHPDGRIVAVGRNGSNNSPLAVIAVDAGGVRDTGFGVNGIYFTPETNAGIGAAVGWNGSEIIVASRRTPPVNDDAVITALSAAGARNSLTYTTLSFSYGNYMRPKVLPDGRILAIGNVSSWGTGAFRVSRFNPDGSLDASFGGSGHSSFVTSDDWLWGARDFALQPDGAAVVTGGFGSPFNAEQTFGVARVLADGNLDLAFNPGPNAGQSTIVVPDTFNASAGRTVRLQGDGKILVASRYTPSAGGRPQMLAIRFNTDGSLDTSYGSGGLAKSAFPQSSASVARAMDLDSIGRAVLMGDGAGEVRLTRFTTTGALDPGFGVGGMASFPLPSGYSLLFTAGMGFVLPTGKVLAVLNASKGSDGVVGLMRANADGTLDTAFGIGGFSFITVSPGVANNGIAFHAAVAPNGRIAVVGFGIQGAAVDIPMVARFLPNGAPDKSFGSGSVRYYPSLPGGWLFGVDFAADGAMVLTGSTGGGGRIFGALVKTVADGSATGPNLVGAVSRKFHSGQANALNLPLDLAPPVTGAVTVEPRVAGTGHTIVFQFDAPISSIGTASITDANGVSLGQVTPTFSDNEVRIPLPPIADMTRARVSITGVNGLSSAEVGVGFMIGDVTSSRRISAADISALKTRRGLLITQSGNFVYDLDLKGSVDDVDLSIVKARSGTILP